LKYPVASAAPVTSTVPLRTSEGMATTLKERVNWKGPPTAAAAAEELSSTVIVIVVGAAEIYAAKSDAEKMILHFILKDGIKLGRLNLRIESNDRILENILL